MNERINESERNQEQMSERDMRFNEQREEQINKQMR
jgi:hypothetical protein